MYSNWSNYALRYDGRLNTSYLWFYPAVPDYYIIYIVIIINIGSYFGISMTEKYGTALNVCRKLCHNNLPPIAK